jgi:tetratricopeptide (TPR) repeat protein
MLAVCLLCLYFPLSALTAVAAIDPAAKRKASERFGQARESFDGSQYAKAAEELVQSLQLNPQQPLAAKLLGICYQVRGDLKSAASAFLEATKLDGSDPESWFLLGRAYYMQHLFESARKVLETAERLDFQNPQVHELLALDLETIGDTEGALKEYTEAVRWNNKIPRPFATPHLSYGTFLHKLNRLEDSEQQLRIATTLNPKDWMAHFEMGKLYYDLDRFEAAVEELTEASRTAKPGSEDAARVYRLLGRTYYRMGRDEDAQSAIAMAGK